jgi:hypothetical protein
MNQNETNSITTNLSIIKLVDGIIEFRFKHDEYEVGINDIKEFQNAITELTQSITPVLVVTGRYGSVNKEARETEMFNLNNHSAIAIIVHGLPQRIFAKFYFTFKNRYEKIPHKLFSNEKDALKWLNSFK